MGPIRIAVIDDERPSRSELCHLIREIEKEALIDEGDSGYQALELAAEHRYDVMFVDIHLGDISGTKLSLMLKKLQPHLQIVFATAYDTYALKAFDLDATDYIMKPFDPLRVKQALHKVALRMESQEGEVKVDKSASYLGKLSVTLGTHVILLDIVDIAYIESLDGNCVIHSKQKHYNSSQSLSYYEHKLASSRFFRTHKSYLVNLGYVIELFQWNSGSFCVKLKDYEKEAVPVSRKQIKLLRDIFEV